MAKAWGTPTWFFFHSFLHHINPQVYIDNRDQIKMFITCICNSLPCPDCTEHAKKYLKQHMNNAALKDKESCKIFLYTFHNSVNARLGKAKFTDFSMYENSNFNKIFSYFKDKYTRNTTLTTGFSDSMQRRNIVTLIEKFLNNTWTHR